MNVFNNVSSQVSGLGSSLGSWFKKDSKDDGDSNVDLTVKESEVVKQPELCKGDTSSKSKDEENDALSQHSG